MDVLLEVKDIDKVFGGLRALNNVNLQVRSGQVVGLIGPNGAGKSTLVDIIAGRTKPTAGTVLLHGADLTAKPAHVRARLGLIRTFQSTKTFPLQSGVEATMAGYALSARDSFVEWVFRPRSAARERRRIVEAARTTLSRLNLQSALTDEPVGTLAPGVNRMLGFALAMASNPRLLILDEPGAGLSHSEKDLLSGRIRESAETGVGVLVIEHDVPFIMATCDRVVAMDHGVVIADGDPEAVRNDPKVQVAYLGSLDAGT